MHVSPLSLPPLPFSLSLLILFLAQPRPAYHPKYSISCTDRLPRRICHGNVKPVNSKIASPDSSIAAVAAPSRRPGPWDHITPISLSATLSALVHIVSGEITSGAGDPKRREGREEYAGFLGWRHDAEKLLIQDNVRTVSYMDIYCTIDWKNVERGAA
ncbi:uncharacterized protein TRIREDRAFT_107208 [Trichoderma reesei QM6a]|uniref:Predicted protein n=2 Tax=Hypocrea jecorina TaxID=51453 RepID=G0RJ04_HYPJQ|nr:uncharacterized protein TRIREDRAFT_107208 [Trichoderma reesei QM6a]EGR48515.1 predicted protein [Trichoderma reesei QM6a]ETS01346.1 hypothetical protein M419DRAFT_130386 [Trichoderma reesei RUT C-30]